VNRRVAGLAVLIALLGGAFAYLYLQPSGGETITCAAPLPTTQKNLPGVDWPTYHADNSRSGYAPFPNFTSAFCEWRSVRLDGLVYAEPLVYANSVYVATESNSLYSLNASTGVVIWRTNLGPPVRGSSLPCGDIDPSGITGTPVIDSSSRLIYVVAFLNPPHHVLFAVRLDDGKVRFQQQADPEGADPDVQQQRAALSLASGYVYVPYGGLFGDCGDYHGWVVGLRVDGSGGNVSYQVPTSREGGIWAPSGAAIDSSGNLYVATGNGASSSTLDHGNSVIELSPSLRELDYFAPSNWAQLNRADLDLGSVGPALISNGTIFQIGKEGVGYLLNASTLGGVGGQLFSMGVCAGAYGGVAYSQQQVFVPCTNGLFAVKVDGASFQVVWHSNSFFAGPPIVTGGAVWTIDRSGTLYAFSLDGKEIFRFSVAGAVHFATPSSGAGGVFVPAGNQLLAFVTNV
jgi:outer membrane protein assembly factor BamB